MSDRIPQEFICPITLQMMNDPYIDEEGNSYELSAIRDWIAQNRASPITRTPLDMRRMVPNRVLKTLIEDYRMRQEQGNSAESKDSGEGKGPEPAQPLTHRLPLRLYAVIDTSGSMSLSCTENKDAEGEMTQFSRLDLVKHTLNTIIMSLTEHDELCIITFSTNAQVFQLPTRLTEPQKHVIMEKIKYIQPDNQTNLWDGIRAALDVIAHQCDASPGAAVDAVDSKTCTSNTEIFVLTDGEPNINPPRPIQETVVRYIDKRIVSKGHLRSVRISTFGYGYKLDSSMLFDIAANTGGTFGFIPDASMVGTVFINALAKSLITSSPAGAALPSIVSNRHAVDVIDRFISMLSSVGRAIRAGGGINPVQELEKLIERLERTRVELNEDLAAAAAGDGTAQQSSTVSQLREAILFVEDMLLDCRPTDDPQLGQIYKAFLPEYITKWGQHYMFSVLTAFLNRCCINFKDKAMQHFRTELFIAEQERIEDVFLDIKPPKPSITSAAYGYRGAAPTGAAAAPPTNMARFYNASGGCFSGDSVVVAAAGSGRQQLVRLDALQRGAVVLSDRGWTAVECMVKLRYTGPLYRVTPHLVLTAYHPVLLPLPHGAPHDGAGGESDAVGDAAEEGGITAFPCECGSIVAEAFDGYVYDMVLENRRIVACPPANNAVQQQQQEGAEGEKFVYAATFGHQCQIGKFAHAYFGSERVVADLKKLDVAAYEHRGEMTLEAYEFTRGMDNRVTGIQV